MLCITIYMHIETGSGMFPHDANALEAVMGRFAGGEEYSRLFLQSALYMLPNLPFKLAYLLIKRRPLISHIGGVRYWLTVTSQPVQGIEFDPGDIAIPGVGPLDRKALKEVFYIIPVWIFPHVVRPAAHRRAGL